MFYRFNQNNSGGSFITDEINGITTDVIIEADNAKQANDIAERIGLYFNGCDDGTDCDCCGDRWYAVDELGGTKEPEIYGVPLDKATKGMFRHNVFVHYKDRSFKEFILLTEEEKAALN